jgi:hypothetical protein
MHTRSELHLPTSKSGRGKPGDAATVPTRAPDVFYRESKSGVIRPAVLRPERAPRLHYAIQGLDPNSQDLPFQAADAFKTGGLSAPEGSEYLGFLTPLARGVPALQRGRSALPSQSAGRKHFTAERHLARITVAEGTAATHARAVNEQSTPVATAQPAERVADRSATRQTTQTADTQQAPRSAGTSSAAKANAPLLQSGEGFGIATRRPAPTGPTSTSLMRSPNRPRPGPGSQKTPRRFLKPIGKAAVPENLAAPAKTGVAEKAAAREMAGVAERAELQPGLVGRSRRPVPAGPSRRSSHSWRLWTTTTSGSSPPPTPSTRSTSPGPPASNRRAGTDPTALFGCSLHHAAGLEQY